MRKESDARRDEQRARRAPRFCRSLAVLCCGLWLLINLASCTSHPVEETVTTDASRSSALPPGAEPVAIAPDLPERDENIEAAGDRIAEAITYLNTRQRDRREKALNALNQAEVVMNRALRAKPRNAQIHSALRAALKDLDAAQRAIQRGTTDTAAKQLATLNKSLDNLDLRQTNDQPATEQDEEP
jgi:ribosomal protein S20